MSEELAPLATRIQMPFRLASGQLKDVHQVLAEKAFQVRLKVGEAEQLRLRLLAEPNSSLVEINPRIGDPLGIEDRLQFERVEENLHSMGQTQPFTALDVEDAKQSAALGSSQH